MNNSRHFLPIAFLVLTIFGTAHAQVSPASTSWSKVPPVDWSKLKPEDFSDDELDLPYYLGNFNKLANSVVETGENRGFIDLSVWRNQQDNKPYNARIMENILSLAFFYSTKRPWNQYYGSPVVRDRLEAALDFWCRIQSPDGRFSEYGPQQWNLAATAFATKFMGQTLTLLRGGPPITSALMTRVAAADRRAIQIVLTDPDLYRHGKDFTNQYTNMWAGALAFLKLYPDPDLDKLVPLLVGPNDKLIVKAGEVTLMRTGKVFSIKFDPQANATTVDTGLKVGPRRVITVQLRSQSNLSYRFDFSAL